MFQNNNELKITPIITKKYDSIGFSAAYSTPFYNVLV